ncbi:MAG: hypothetical protein K2F63_01755 [Muribaculaceae bacterium]|nr:hypothetical protein [Muribaculaceae bacterium]
MKRSILLTLAIVVICQMAEARQPARGYRGFFEWSSSVRSDNFGVLDIYGNIKMERQGSFYTGFTTSHGYQINHLFFVGAGLGMERCGRLDNWVAPLFIQGRLDIQFGKFTPFADLRLGANVAEGAGIYLSPTIGYRINWGRKMGVNIGAGLTLAGYRAEHYQGTWVAPDSFEIHYVETKHHVRPYFSFRVGIDF